MANKPAATGSITDERVRELIAHPDVAMLHEISRLAQSEIDRRSGREQHDLTDERGRRRAILLLSAYAEVTERTAARAAEKGIDVISGFSVRSRLRRAAVLLGLTLPFPEMTALPALPAPKLSLVSVQAPAKRKARQ